MIRSLSAVDPTSSDTPLRRTICPVGNPIMLPQILERSSSAMITGTYQHLAFGDDAHDERMGLLASEHAR